MLQVQSNPKVRAKSQRYTQWADQAQSITRATKSFDASVRFGKGESVDFNLPSWTKNVKPPAMTLPKLKQTMEALESGEKPKNHFKALGIVLKTAYAFYQLKRQVKKTSRNYLPQEAKKDLRKYQWTIGLFDRLFRKNRYELMSIVHQGPIAIKTMQTVAQTEASTVLPMLEAGVSILKDSKKRAEVLKGSPAWLSATSFIWRPLAIYWSNKKIASIQNRLLLLNQVPPIPKKEFQKQIKTLQAAYNAAHPNDPIQDIGETLNAGSVGQVFKAKTQQGKQLVLKIAKPNITNNYLDGYKPYLYFLEQVFTGTGLTEQKQAARNAENSVALLKQEIDFKQEAINAENIRKASSALGLQGFRVPEVLASTQQGLILPFVGKQDFANMSQADKNEALVKMVPDLVKLMVLSPYKPLDIHAGNIRSKDEHSGTAPYLIDHGRQANLDSTAHQNLLRLLPLIKGVGIQSALTQPNVQKALEDILKLDEAHNQKALNDLHKLKTIENLKALLDEQNANYIYSFEDKESAKSKQAVLDRVNPQLKPLSDLSEMLKTLCEKPETRDIPAIGLSNHINRSIMTNPTLLNYWGQAIQTLTSNSSTAITTHPIPAADMQNYHRKMAAFMRPYFWAPASATEDKEIRDKLSSMTKEDYRKTFRRPEDKDRPLFDLSMYLDEGFFNCVFDRDKPASAKPTNASENNFNNLRQELLKPGNKKGDLLVRAYRANTRMQQLASSITDILAQQHGQPLNSSDYNYLQAYVESALRSDLGVTASILHKENYLGLNRSSRILKSD